MVRCEWKKITQVEFSANLAKTNTRKDEWEYCVLYGIYKAKVILPDGRSESECCEFRFNRYNKYTHIDLQTALKQGLRVEIIEGTDDDEDEGMNFMRYSKLTQGRTLFDHAVSCICDLKCDAGKELRSAAWGSLCKGNKSYITYTEEDKDDIIIYDNKEILDIHKMSDGVTTKITLGNCNQFYETNYARMKPFIQAGCRQSIINDIMKYAGNTLVRCHVDSMMLSKPNPEIPISKEMGGLKYEGCIKGFQTKDFTKMNEQIREFKKTQKKRT